MKFQGTSFGCVAEASVDSDRIITVVSSKYAYKLSDLERRAEELKKKKPAEDAEKPYALRRSRERPRDQEIIS